jgi:hypothetical protein
MRPVRAVSSLALATVLAVSACGGSSSNSSSSEPSKPTSNGVEKLTAKAIVDKAEAAAKKASSVHISGEATSSGETFGIDMRVSSTKGAQGHIELGGARIEVLRIGTDAYIKADKAFWGQLGDPAVAAKLADKYVKGSTTDAQFKAFLDFTDITKIFGEILNNSGKVTKVPGKTVAGAATIGVNDADKANGGTLYVATTGEPYPLLIEPNAASGDKGRITLGNWNEPVTLTPPPPAQVIDINSLGG